jgi:hypothetical protein
MAEINALAADILEEIVGRAGDAPWRSMCLWGICWQQLSAGEGPGRAGTHPHAQLLPYRLHNELTAAGINQTRHRIVFEVSVAIDV